MKRAKQNGSLLEPKLSTLKFFNPFQKTSKRHWTFRRYLGKAGIYVVKEIDLDTKKKKVIRVGKVTSCLYKASIRYIEKRMGNGANFTIAFILPPEKKNLNHWLRETSLAIKKDLATIHHFSSSYQRIKKMIEKKRMSPRAVLSTLKFQPPFTGKQTKDGRNIWTFSGATEERKGSYVILEQENGKNEWIIAYCGLSYSQLVGRMYTHFYVTGERQVEYSQKLGTHSYKIALVEIPGSNEKSPDQANAEVQELEDFLVVVLDPRDNDPEEKEKAKSRLNSEPQDNTAYFDDPENAWMKPTPDDDIPF